MLVHLQAKRSSALHHFREEQSRLTVTVLKTCPLVAKLLARDLASFDSLSLSVRSSPVLESGSLGVVETTGPSGLLGGLQGIQERHGRVGRVEITVVRTTTGLRRVSETSGLAE